MNNPSLENYLYINKNSLSNEICIDIINLFESEKKSAGITRGGYRPHVKDTLDFQIPTKNVNKPSHWMKIRELLEKELTNNVQKYVKYIDTNTTITEDSNEPCKVLGDVVSFETLQIQKYKKLEGKYIYHPDFVSDWQDKKFRVITYLWYLNNVEEGGETEFWGKYRIKPETGKLLLFPATWTYPHRGMMPISNDKYILTGWIYNNA